MKLLFWEKDVNIIKLSKLTVTGGSIYLLENGTNEASFQVSLYKPENVTLQITSNGNSVNFDKVSLDFTTGDYNVPQTVTITGKNGTADFGVRYETINVNTATIERVQFKIRIADSNIDASLLSVEPLTESNFTDDASLNTFRQSSIDWIWGTGYGNGDGSLPSTTITNFTTFAGDSFLDLSGLSNYSSAESGSIIMGSGSDWTQYFYKLISSTDNGKWFVIPTGHGDDWTGPGIANGYELLFNNLLANGYNILSYYMCGRGPNTTEAGITQGTGGTGGTHDQMATLESSSPYFNPMEYFITPSIVCINYAVSQTASNIYLTGISGGGWESIWSGSLDTRIEKIFNVAGNYPNFIKWAYGEVGDYEQAYYNQNTGAPDARTTAFFVDQIKRVKHLDLYAMASQNRAHYQWNNINDSCCFESYYNTIYKTELQRKLTGIGTFDAFLYDETGQHTYNQTIIDNIIALS
jgi:hypothetical protein